jgi:hypothetical protein
MLLAKYDDVVNLQRLSIARFAVPNQPIWVCGRDSGAFFLSFRAYIFIVRQRYRAAFLRP